MTRLHLARCAAALLAFVTFQVVAAQEGRVAMAASSIVRFELAPDEVIAGGACPGCAAIAPLPGTSVVLEVRRQNPNRPYTLVAVAEGDAAGRSLVLQGRFSAIDPATGESLWTTSWLPLNDAPTEVLSQRQVGTAAWVEVVPEYRVLLTGQERGGTHLVSVRYRVRETGSTVAHDIVVTVPTFLIVRAVDAAGSPVGGGPVFDLTRDPRAYLDAVLSGRTLRPDASTFDRVEVATNAARGYRITVALDEIGGASEDSAVLRDRVQFDGQPAHGRVYRVDVSSTGFRTLLRLSDITLTLDGSEAPGTHRFMITFRALANP